MNDELSTPFIEPHSPGTNLDNLVHGLETLSGRRGSTREIVVELDSCLQQLKQIGARPISAGRVNRDELALMREQSRKVSNNEVLKEMGLNNIYKIANTPDHGLVSAILTKLKEKPDNLLQQLRAYYLEKDNQNKLRTLNSYAQHGLLTLRSLKAKGVLTETSSTPGDLSSHEDFDEFDDDQLNTLRGYVIDPTNLDTGLLYGRNSLFTVVAERGEEDIDRYHQLSTPDLENRLRNSFLLIVKATKLNIRGRHETSQEEDIVHEDISFEEIDKVMIHYNNQQVARECFPELKLVVVGDRLVDFPTIPRQEVRVPDYEAALREFGSEKYWCHICRLPEDTLIGEEFAD